MSCQVSVKASLPTLKVVKEAITDTAKGTCGFRGTSSHSDAA